jgi:flagellar basal body-associated protein FliL
MADENGTGNNLIWAIAMIIIVAIIAGALYYSGFLSGTKKEADINITVPSGSTR